MRNEFRQVERLHWRRLGGGPGGPGPTMAGQKRIDAMFTSERRY